MISILTPTYNREKLLIRIYESLLKQTNKDFEWVIIDDGSTDNTKEIIKKLIDQNKIKIRYFYKKNGGKHTAINEGMKKINDKYTFILDSDDYLLDNAIEMIYEYWNKYDNQEKIAALSFNRIYDNNKKIGRKVKQDIIIGNNISYRYNKNIKGDMAEIYKTEILKSYPFPVYNKERFLSEAIVWNKIALNYDTVYINKPLVVGEYQKDGLTSNSLILRYKNPIGALENANLFLIKEFKLSIRVKNAIIYVGFSKVNKRKIKEIINKSNNKHLTILLYPAGLLFYIFLELKNRRK